MQHNEMMMVIKEENSVGLIKDEVQKGFIAHLFPQGSPAHSVTS